MIQWNELPPDALEDCFRPPDVACTVHCIHCDNEYSSDRIEWRKAEGATIGFWCCPMEGCNGRGFGFDIFPVDPDICAQHGIHVHSCDGDEGEGEWEDDEDCDGDCDNCPRLDPDQEGPLCTRFIDKMTPEDWAAVEEAEREFEDEDDLPGQSASYLRYHPRAESFTPEGEDDEEGEYTDGEEQYDDLEEDDEGPGNPSDDTKHSDEDGRKLDRTDPRPRKSKHFDDRGFDLDIPY